MKVIPGIIAAGFVLAVATAQAASRPELALGRSALYDYDPPEPGSYRLPALKSAGDGDVLGLDGKPHKLRAVLDGHITVLSFIYTRCKDPSACPLATRVLYQLHQVSEQDAELAKHMQLLTFSFDPDHDTPEVMATYKARYEPEQKGAAWRFLTTRSAKALEPILTSYGQPIDLKPNPDDEFGPYSHALRVFLIDRRGVIRNIYSYGLLDPRLVITDVRTLLIEERSAK